MISLVAQPGGSVDDEEVINSCNDYGMTMAFTDVRLFHHYSIVVHGNYY